MSNFLEDMAYRQYENKLPERYEEKPLFKCEYCGEDIFYGERIAVINDDVCCCHCALITYAGGFE
ncbi:MAG: hypothetical protein IJ305_08730 [Oscillospiraceae bacterium]|nr:hypothetical protein [Oscillospiraceae bacterium]